MQFFVNYGLSKSAFVSLQGSKEVFRAECAMEEGRKLRNNLLSLSGNIINRIVAFFEGFSVSFEELINFISKNIMNQIVIILI